jgi:hypothetical protein
VSYTRPSADESVSVLESRRADVPKDLIANATTVEAHFDLVNFQMLQVRTALTPWE